MTFGGNGNGNGNVYGVGVWSSVAWRDEAVSWLDERLAAAGIERTGAVEQPRVRPWATVLTAPTSRGPVWLKAAGPGTAFEVALYELLHRVAPDHVLTPIATDPARGWIVLPDGGPSIEEGLGNADLVDAMATVLPMYGQLQRDVAPHADGLVALGVSDMRAEVMPARFDEALDAVRGYVELRGDADEGETWRRVAAMRGTFVSWCEELAAAPGSPSLDHNDLHPSNILTGSGRVTFYDWGDSVVAHPFASMLVTLGILRRYYLKVPVDAPEIRRLRDAYLEAFSDLAPHAELVGTLELACRVGKAARVLTWDRAVRAEGDGAGEFAGAPLECLASLLDESYLGGT